MQKVYMICTLTVIYSLLSTTSALTACQCPHLVQAHISDKLCMFAKHYRHLARTLTSLVTAWVDIKTHSTLIVQIIHERYMQQCCSFKSIRPHLH